MTDTSQARRMMVDGQIRANDVTEWRLIEAFLDTPREDFLPAAKKALAYIDMDVPVSADGSRHVVQPMVLAKMLQAAGIRHTDSVLDVGAALGYSSAILSRLAARVVALECDEALAGEARAALAAFANVSVVAGPLEKGAPQSGPYDVIVLEGAAQALPPAILSQLAEGGRLVAVFGIGSATRAVLSVKGGGEVSGREIFDASLPPLPGFSRMPEFAL